ncbi:MAG: bifunctional UDP-N-acetylglucosamine diphosphorylase/glucosamine-1-phosphate N-acetyltransferase GlmU [Peptococcaceae bacterium]
MNVAIVLAAGQGTRMKSELPKVLHRVMGKPMLEHVLSTLSKVQVDRKILVLGHGAEKIQESLQDRTEFVYQREQLGTGHAVMQAEDLLDQDMKNVLVVCGDTPLLRAETLDRLIAKHDDSDAVVTILTSIIDNPEGYGRIIRQNGQVIAIVEEKDAAEEEKKICEINTGTYCFTGAFLKEYLNTLTNNNTQQEYYLTDLIKIAVANNLKVAAHILEDIKESLGINNKLQLAEAEQVLRQRTLEKLMLAGVTIIDPCNTYIHDTVEIGTDTVIYPGSVIEGIARIGKECTIGPHTRVIDSTIGDYCVIQNSVITESRVAANCNIGPFAYLRPGAVLNENVKVGDFVEIKKSEIGKDSKVPHLSYIGDAVIGEQVNIGCGTITCNYDGREKHVTIIEDRAFVGSNTNLIAPVKIGKDTVIGAGSSINQDVPDKALGIARQRQKNIPDWVKDNK